MKTFKHKQALPDYAWSSEELQSIRVAANDTTYIVLGVFQDGSWLVRDLTGSQVSRMRPGDLHWQS